MIDPTKPIEAVHPDGRVVPMELDTNDGYGLKTKAGTAWELLGGDWFYWNYDGSPRNAYNPWTIRNVAEPELSDPDDWAIEEALKRSGHDHAYGTTLDNVKAFPNRYKITIALARMIQRYQPELEPKRLVDPDVLAVREILGATHIAYWGTHGSSAYAEGEMDHMPWFLAAVAAFRRVKGGVS